MLVDVLVLLQFPRQLIELMGKPSHRAALLISWYVSDDTLQNAHSFTVLPQVLDVMKPILHKRKIEYELEGFGCSLP